MPKFQRAAAIAALALTPLAACGGAATKSAAPAAQATTSTTAAPTPLQLVLASSQKVADNHTMRFSMTMGMPQGSFTGEGAMDTKGPLMSMTMDMASMLTPAERKAGTSIAMILNDQAMYMRYPGLTAATGGKHWIRLDLATLGGDNPLAPLASQLRDADPSKSVAFLDGAQDVTTVGVEDVRGVSTTRYRFTIDLQKALAGAPASLRSALSAAVSQLGTATLPGEVWLDGDGLPRRFAYDMSLPAGAGAGAPAAVHFTMEMFDFGQPVQVSLPADSDVIDSGALGGATPGVKS